MKVKKYKIDVKLNKSLTYFLPLVDAQVDFKFIFKLRNSYIRNNNEEKEFCVLYEWSSNPDYTKWEQELMNHHLFIGHEDYDKMVLYKFRLSKNMKEALILFENGKYSLFTPEHKAAIDNFLKKRNASNRDRIMKILDRDEEIRLELQEKFDTKIDPNEELSSPPDYESETFSGFVKELELKIDQFNEDDGEVENS